MTDDQLKILNEKIDALNTNLTRAHAEEFQWAQTIMARQQQFESRLGFDTTPRQFTPYYHPSFAMSAEYPEIFNKYGKGMEFFFHQRPRNGLSG